MSSSVPVSSSSSPSPSTRDASSARPLASTAPRAYGGRVTLIAAAWGAVGVALAASGLLARAPFLVPALLVASIAGPVVAFRRSPALRAWVDALPPRALTLAQVARAAFGAVFLAELARGALPEAFALRAGIGDIAVGLLAPLAALAWPLVSRLRSRAFLAFHLVGILDLAMVVATAQVGLIADHDPLLLASLPRLPYALLPTFVVPLAVLAHLAALRLRRVAPGGAR